MERHNKTGSSRKSWVYFDLMADILSKNPAITPPLTVSSLDGPVGKCLMACFINSSMVTKGCLCHRNKWWICSCSVNRCSLTFAYRLSRFIYPGHGTCIYCLKLVASLRTTVKLCKAIDLSCTLKNRNHAWFLKFANGTWNQLNYQWMCVYKL